MRAFSVPPLFPPFLSPMRCAVAFISAGLVLAAPALPDMVSPVAAETYDPAFEEGGLKRARSKKPRRAKPAPVKTEPETPRPEPSPAEAASLEVAEPSGAQPAKPQRHEIRPASIAPASNTPAEIKDAKTPPAPPERVQPETAQIDKSPPKPTPKPKPMLKPPAPKPQPVVRDVYLQTGSIRKLAADPASAAEAILRLTRASGWVNRKRGATLAAQMALVEERFPDLSQAERKAVEALIAAGYERRVKLYMSDVAKMYAKSFTRAELEEMARFFSSKPGRKLLERLPLMLQNTIFAADMWHRRVTAGLNREVRAKLNILRKEREAPAK